jgi:hypothetical protein
VTEVSGKVPGEAEKWDDVIRKITSVWTPEVAAEVLAAITKLDLRAGAEVGDVPTWDGTKYTPVGSVQVATTVLTANEIKALHTTPKQLVAAPGAGKFLFPQRTLFDFVPGTVPYTNPNGSSFYAIYGVPPDTGSNRVTYYDAGVLTNAGRTISPEPVTLSDYVASMVLGMAINFTLDQAVLLGNGTLTVTIVYLTI